MELPYNAPILHLQRQSELILLDLRRLKALLQKAYNSDLWRAYRRVAAEVDVHVDKIYKTIAACCGILGRLGDDLTTYRPKMGRKDFDILHGKLHAVLRTVSLTSALEALRQTMRTQLVYPWGLNAFVHGTFIPFVERYELPIQFGRAEVLRQGMPLLTQFEERLQTTVRITREWDCLWREVCRGFRPEAVLRIHQLPPEVREHAIGPVTAVIAIAERCKHGIYEICYDIGLCNCDRAGRTDSIDRFKYLDPNYIP
ncbi:hypothetical protein K525DRAFT_281952 [Schizophyllum commune Loenen D]|nr:hypothetical protein K525DRAFT_281952 [Schizophyllum commune Loenen D]